MDRLVTFFAALGVGCLVATLILAIGDLVVHIRRLRRPRWQRWLDALRQGGEEESDRETGLDFLPLLPAGGGLALALLARDWLLSPYLLLLGLALARFMQRRRSHKKHMAATEQVKALVVLFRSHFAVGQSPFAVLGEVFPELPPGQVRTAVEKAVSAYRAGGDVRTALASMRKVDERYLSRFTLVLEAAPSSDTETILDEVRRLEEDLMERDRLRGQAKASLALLTGTVRFLQVANVTTVVLTVLLPPWRDFFTSTLQRRGTFLAATLFFVLASLYFDQEARESLEEAIP